MSSEQVKDSKMNEKLIAEFQQLRNEQRNLVNNLNTLEMDLKEHKTVIDTLKTVDPDRKCFRLIGGVLCERTVKEVLPQLVENKDFIEKTITLVTDDLTKKGLQINKFKEEHNIRIRGEQLAGDGQKSQSIYDTAMMGDYIWTLIRETDCSGYKKQRRSQQFFHMA